MQHRVLISSLLMLTACGSGPTKGGGSAGANAADPMAAMKTAIAELQARPEVAADAVTVQHVLISFAGAGTKATRSKHEAEGLAAQVLQEANSGADFGALVVKHTDDSPPGIYAMVADAKHADMAHQIYARTGMVPAFGDVGWRLQVGQIGIAPFDAQKSPYGWHIIKRIK